MRHAVGAAMAVALFILGVVSPAAAGEDNACTTVVQFAPLATTPGVSDLPLPVLLTTDVAVRGFEFELTLPADFALRDCLATLPGYTCTMRNTAGGVRFVVVAFDGAPIPAGSAQPVAELIVDVVPEVLDRVVVLAPGAPRVLSDACDACASSAAPGDVQIVAGCEFFVEELEDGAEGWTSSVRSEEASPGIEKIADPIGPDTWHLATTTCDGVPLGSTMYVSNGNRGPTCQPDSSRDLSQLLGPPIGLPFSDALVLEFDALSYDEAGECRSGGQFDRHDVGLTTDGGLTYTVLNDCTALADGSGTPIRHRFDISDFGGRAVQLMFVYDTGDTLNGHTFAVDNVRITALDMICGACDGLILVDPPPAQATLDLEACGVIVAGGAFHVAAGRDVTLRSGTHIVLKDGFRVEAGARFGAIVDPAIVDVSKAPRRLAYPASRAITPLGQERP